MTAKGAGEYGTPGKERTIKKQMPMLPEHRAAGENDTTKFVVALYDESYESNRRPGDVR